MTLCVPNMSKRVGVDKPVDPLFHGGGKHI